MEFTVPLTALALVVSFYLRRGSLPLHSIPPVPGTAGEQDMGFYPASSPPPVHQGRYCAIPSLEVSFFKVMCFINLLVNPKKNLQRMGKMGSYKKDHIGIVSDDSSKIVCLKKIKHHRKIVLYLLYMSFIFPYPL